MQKIYDVENVENLCENVPAKYLGDITKLTLNMMKHDAYAKP